MKKVFMWAFAALFMGSMVLTSCSKEGDDNAYHGSDQLLAEYPKNMTMSYTYYVTEDMLRFLDIVVTYNDGTGEKQDTVTTLHWTKTMTNDLPAGYSFSYKARVKEGMYETMAALDSFSFTRHYSYSYNIMDSTGNVVSTFSFSSPDSLAQMDAGATIADKYNRGKFDTDHEFMFSAEGLLTKEDRSGELRD